MKELTDSSCIRTDVDASTLQELRRDALQNSDIIALSSLMKAVGNETRLRILYVLWKAEELCVCDLSDIFGISQPAISRHLKIMREKALVQSRREAQTLFHSIYTDSPFAEMLIRVFEEQELAGITLSMDPAV